MQITEHCKGAHLFPNTYNLSHSKRRHLAPTLRLAFLSLADAFGCRIEVYSNTALSKPQYNNQPPRQIYCCTPGSSSTQYEVHVLSVYELVNTRQHTPSAGDAAVNIVSGGQSGRPIVLVFASLLTYVLKPVTPVRGIGRHQETSRAPYPMPLLLVDSR